MRVLVPWQSLVDSMQIPGVETVLWNINDGEPPAADVLVTERPLDPAHRSRVSRIPGLKHVHLLSLGYEWVLEHLPGEAVLSNSRGAVEDSTAEHCLALVLATLRELPAAMASQKEQEWPRLWTSSLFGSNVVVLGVGGVGTATIERLKAFKPARITGVASSPRILDDGTNVVALRDAAELLPEADVVICTLPHTPQTQGLIDAGFLQRMRDGALLVNVGRGPIVNTADLLDELRSGRLRAALDVTDPEPLPTGHPLWTAPNCIITPHMAGDTSEFMRLVSDLATQQVQLLSTGSAPHNIVHRNLG
ncbi:NAD(P)-dependent oxidoreductase [Glutamicibacter ardleyensis]